MAELTHKSLCALAVKWLKRPYSRDGHGCHVAVEEARSGWDGEVPDAIGFHLNGNRVDSVVVEVKVSRGDFLSDKAKPHRAPGLGMGNWRYYLCPEGLIQPEELPAGWGLLWVNSRGHIKPKAGAVACPGGGWKARQEHRDAWRQPADQGREAWLLVKLLSRVGDSDKLNRMIREANAAWRLARAECDRLQAEAHELRLANVRQQRWVAELEKQLEGAACTI